MATTGPNQVCNHKNLLRGKTTAVTADLRTKNEPKWPIDCSDGAETMAAPGPTYIPRTIKTALVAI